MSYADLGIYEQNHKRIRVGNHELAYWQAGEGDDLLLIHGFPSAAWDWHPIWENLCQQYRVTAVDLLGFGLSDKPHPHRYQVVEQADLVSEVLAKLGIEKLHVLAHDYGDSVAQAMLTLHSGEGAKLQIESVCFLNGGIFPHLHRPLLTQTLLKGMFGPLIAKGMGPSSLKKSFTRIFGDATPPKENEIESLWQLLNTNQGKRVLPSLLTYIDERKAMGDVWTNTMKTCGIPLCFINGVQDPISGAHMADEFETLFTLQRLVRLDCGHYPQLEMPDLVLQHYREFRATS
ncbi:alpha/beta hydrolase [Aliiglaciecola sp.]|nr:alpha/beta hydrolase [Aliiglaciecola sp.]